MRIVETMQKADWSAIMSQFTGIALLLGGVLLCLKLLAPRTSPEHDSQEAQFSAGPGAPRSLEVVEPWQPSHFWRC